MELILAIGFIVYSVIAYKKEEQKRKERLEQAKNAKAKRMASKPTFEKAKQVEKREHEEIISFEPAFDTFASEELNVDDCMVDDEVQVVKKERLKRKAPDQASIQVESISSTRLSHYKKKTEVPYALTANRLKEAYILREIIDKPVALREEG